VLRILLAAAAALLFAFFALAVTFGAFADPTVRSLLLTGFAGIAAMALQNALQRVHLANAPPTTIMTGNTTQATIDAVDLLIAPKAGKTAEIRARFVRVALSIVYFAAGRAASATLYWLVGFWCLAVAVVVGTAAAVMRTEALRPPAPTARASIIACSDRKMRSRRLQPSVRAGSCYIFSFFAAFFFTGGAAAAAAASSASRARRNARSRVVLTRMAAALFS
jgi:uncharacterized protein DUF1275